MAPGEILMLKTFFVRDRLVMAGLIMLGLATVAAGFVSGRSTFQYALSTDARQASAQWVKRVEGQLFRDGLTQQHRRHRRVDASRHPTDYPPVGDR